MIDSSTLLKDLQKRVKMLEDDLRRRCDGEPQVNAPLQARYEAARASARTAETFNAWRDEQIAQIAVAWVLACVFVRFLEDNRLLDSPFLAGPDAARMNRARDEQELFFSQHPTASERDYLLHVFEAVGELSGMKEFFDRRHNPLWLAGPTGDALAGLLDFWRKTDPDTGALAHDFTDPRVSSLSHPMGEGRGEGDPTRFLGDLYQDLSEFARKRYALLQTPEFVEEFILDRTLTPAIEGFGYRVVRMLDPTCGSGHFLLGGFERLFRRWQEHEPGENTRVLAQRALDQVCGVDLNPNVVAIARFRLLLAALRASAVTRLKDAPDFQIHLAVGDSLLHGARFLGSDSHEGVQQTFDGEEVFRDELKHFYDTEDRDLLHRILGRQYHAVVGNPPYITVKDKALNQLYRNRFDSCHRKYSLAAPFMERFFDLALKGDPRDGRPAGFVGMITANSFMKREFGKKLIEECIPRWDFTHVIDTSGAYIPGHGTPTVILFGKHQPPVAATIRTIMGIKGEPATPEDPARGLVWSAILRQVDQPGSESDFVSVADAPRENFHKHPWSIGGGGAAELKEQVDEAAEKTLYALVGSIGFASFAGLDDAFIIDEATLLRAGFPESMVREFVTGDVVRDWEIAPGEFAFAPYDSKYELSPLKVQARWARHLWLNRVSLEGVVSFGGRTRKQLGADWWGWYRWIPEKYRIRLTITFGEVATHNHFVLDRGGKVFNRTAPVIKLPSDATEDDHLGLLGLLNSSTACFWLKQTCFPKGGDHQGNEGARVRSTLWDERFAFNSTQVGALPIPAEKPLSLARELDRLAQELKAHVPVAVLSAGSRPHLTPALSPPSGSGEGEHSGRPDMANAARGDENRARDHRDSLSPQRGEGRGEGWEHSPTPPPAPSPALRDALATARQHWTGLLQRMIALQEELDWECYRIYGLLPDASLSFPAGASESLRLGVESGAPEPTPGREDARTQEGGRTGLPPLKLGERAFEIVMARKMARGELQTAWFERHGSTPITELPGHWPAAYRALVERRIATIESDRNIALIEQPEYKRRWNTEPWEEQQERALRLWMLVRLEGYFFEGERMVENRPHLTPALSPPSGSDEGEPSAHPDAANAAMGVGTPEHARRDSLSPQRGEGRGEGYDEAQHTLTAIRASWFAGQRPALVSVNQLAEVVHADAAFLKVAEVYVGAAGFSVPKLVRELVEAESVPFLPFQRYKESGVRKRQDWERTWELQRKEDAFDARIEPLARELEDVVKKLSGNAESPEAPTWKARKEELSEAIRALKDDKAREVGVIPVPPKYASADFKASAFWRLRGKLDVPKERWISHPGAEREGDPSPVIAWAGWNPLQRAQALAEYYITAKDTWGWSSERLILLLAGLADLLPWLVQWHNDVNPEYGMGLGDYFAGFLEEECRKNATTLEAVRILRIGAAPI